jgi:acyl dehydratase
MRTVGFDALASLAGQEIGVSDWVVIDQERVNKFADATGDHQWIHVDPEKAAQGPFGTTIAHGFLTLSLLVKFIDEVRPSSGEFRMGINYGVNRVRFPAPVPVGSKLRAHFEVLEVADVEGGIQVVTQGTVEREGGEKPVCVAEMVSRHYR